MFSLEQRIFRHFLGRGPLNPFGGNPVNRTIGACQTATAHIAYLKMLSQFPAICHAT
jgi:hypothetical protein